LNLSVTYPITEQFYTIQGEGYNSGMAAYFIRLAGCDVGCVWCDVKESWPIHQDQYQTVEQLVQNVKDSGTNFVVITGGEPLMHNLDALTSELNKLGVKIALETSGAYPLSGTWHWICFSPKKFKKPLDEFYDKAHELKVVVFNQHDLKWAEEHTSKINKACKLYLQPEWDREEEMLPQIINYVKANPKWKISLQIHKYMAIP
jgi:7-carboxy-7-deazaguanine synthase